MSFLAGRGNRSRPAFLCHARRCAEAGLLTAQHVLDGQDFDGA